MHELTQLLAHRGPMLLLTRVIEVADTHAVGEIAIDQGSSFLIPGHGVPGWVALEYMAQTVGLMAGYHAIKGGSGAPQGYLLGTRRLVCDVSWFREGDLIVSRAEETFVDDRGMGVYNCSLQGPDYEATARLTLLKKT